MHKNISFCIKKCRFYIYQ